MLKTFILAALVAVLTIAFYLFYPGKKLPEGVKIDRLVLKKSERKLIAYSKGEQVKSYKVALGKDPVGHKQFEGDMKTPEGIYHIEDRNPNSGYYKNLGVSYPNQKDRAFAEKQGKSPGGLIKIHGLRNGMGILGKLHRFTDWTHGCIALTNPEMEELYQSVIIGSEIEILP